MAGLVAGCSSTRRACGAPIDEGHLVATELADYLVAQGVPFREAHDVAGHLVRAADRAGVELRALSLDELRGRARRLRSTTTSTTGSIRRAPSTAATSSAARPAQRVLGGDRSSADDASWRRRR